MSKTIVSISMSLDGYIAGPNVNQANPLGEGGERLHEWLFKTTTPADTMVLEETMKSSGAVIVGGTTYKTAIKDAWGGTSPFEVPAFVITHSTDLPKVAGFDYITEGIREGLRQAQLAAGEKDIWVMGGANLIQQFLAANLLDELQITIVNVLFGKGISLFNNLNISLVELERVRVVESKGVTHIKYRIQK